MYYVYVLRSLSDGHWYVGRTSDLVARLKLHNAGAVSSTRMRRPLELFYAEMSRDSKDAAHRELYLKSAWGKRYLKVRLKNQLLSHGVSH